MEVIVSRSDISMNSLVVHFARTVDVLAQSIIEIVLGTSFNYLLLVVEFDFRDQQASEATGRVVKATLFLSRNFDREFCVLTVATSLTSRRRCGVNWC